MVEEKSKTSGRGIVVSRFNRRIVFASEVRVEADNSSHLLAVPLMGIFTIQRSEGRYHQRSAGRVRGKIRTKARRLRVSHGWSDRVVGGAVEGRSQAGATALCQALRELQKIIPRSHHPRQSAKKATVQHPAVAPFLFTV